MIEYYIGFLVLGTIVGSFANVIALRLHTGRPIFTGRSQCDSCAEKLSSFDLIPIISFLSLGGRCRKCGSKIGTLHFFAEVALAFLFAWGFHIHGLSLELAVALPFFTLLVSTVIYDLYHTIIPNVFVYALIALAAAMAYLQGDIKITIIAAVGMAALFALTWLLSAGRAMGLGDAKLILALALFVGYPLSITGFLLSFWLGAVIAIFILVIQGKHRTMKHEVPFAPYLALGFICAYVLQLNLLPTIL